MNLASKPRTLDMKTKQAKQQVVILAGLHVVSRDFSVEFRCSCIRVIHKISVKHEMAYLLDWIKKHYYAFFRRDVCMK